MIPPRYWTAVLWVPTIGILVLAAHAIGLATHLAITGPDAPSYTEHAAGGFLPGLIILGLTTFTVISAARNESEGVAATGRALALALIAVALALIALGLPFF